MEEAPSVPEIGQPEDPILGALKIRALAPQLAAGGVAPFLVYQLAHHQGLADSTSLALASIVPALWVAGNWAWRRRLEVIPGLALFGITIGLVAVLALHGSELVLKMRESLITGTLGLAFLASLVLSERPAIYHLGRAMASGQGPAARADFESLWGEERAHRVIHVLTIVWGIGLAGEAAFRALLALWLPTGTFLALAPVVGWVVIGSLMWFTVGYIRNSRQRAAVLVPAAPEADEGP